jgi:hypothetical protein
MGLERAPPELTHGLSVLGRGRPIMMARLAEKPNHESNSELSISVPIILQNPSRLNSADLIAEITLSDWETAKIVADWVSE